ncbi:MAG: hypothetical protein U0559_16385 [Anaerolineae bacterium]
MSRKRGLDRFATIVVMLFVDLHDGVQPRRPPGSTFTSRHFTTSLTFLKMVSSRGIPINQFVFQHAGNNACRIASRRWVMVFTSCWLLPDHIIRLGQIDERPFGV